MAWGTLYGSNGVTPQAVIYNGANPSLYLGDVKVWPPHVQHPDETVIHTSSNTWAVPAWATCVDVICLGGGGGGDSGGAGMRTGTGGFGGAWAAVRLTRTGTGASFLPATLTITVGAGGQGGRAGNNVGKDSTVVHNGVTTIGKGGGVTHLPTGTSHQNGYDVNPLTYTFQGVTVTGGRGGLGNAAVGAAPGGGGAGQVGHFLGPDSPGGAGGKGQVWTIARDI